MINLKFLRHTSHSAFSAFQRLWACNPSTVLPATLCWKTPLMIAFLYSFLSRCGMQSPVLSLYDTFFIRLYLFSEHLFCSTVPSIPPPTSSFLLSLLISFKIESSPFSYLHPLHGLFYFFSENEEQLIYNVVFVSGIWQSDSVMHIYLYAYAFSYSFPL